VKELRFDEDRYISPTARRFSIELARMVDDWRVTIPYIWTEEKMRTWAGEDNVLRTILVSPELFEKGKVNVIPDIESMLPEGRGERQAKARQMWLDGAFGDPADPGAIRKFLDMARFPHMGRAVRPGGQDRIMAEQENGRLAQGHPATSIPIFEWQDHVEHNIVHEEFMKSPDYQKLSPEIQQQFVFHWMMTREAEIAAFNNQLQMEGQRQLVAQQAVADVEAAAPGPALPDSVESPEGAPPGQAAPSEAVA
jgi:hypothetical protein